MNKIKFYLLILSVLIFSFAAQAQTYNFKGNVGASKIQMTLARNGSDLSGAYFYDKQGKTNKLNLKGAIDAGGNFVLKETDATGRQTGAFTGKWSEDETIPSVWLEGVWKSPGGKKLKFSAVRQNIYFTGGLSLIARKIMEKNKPRMYEVEAKYPEITGAANPGVAKFNSLAKQTVAKSVADFKKNMLEFTAEDLKFARDRGTSNYIEISYNVEYADNDLISLRFGEGTYTGGAHPNYYSYTVNYDLKNGREISLADLFKPDSNYLKVISGYSIAKLKSELKEMSDDEWIKTGAGAKAENFKSWNLSEKGLVINFDPYQVAPYAAGAQTVFIPFDKLSEILKPGGVVSRLKK